jgi:hypothetical protein
MPAVFIEFPKTELKFYLFDDEVDETMAKKLSKLGLANLSVDFPENPDLNYAEGDDGLFHAGEISTIGFPVTSITTNSKFSTRHNPNDNSISVYLEGRFFCVNTLDDVKPITDWKDGYVWAIRLRNDKQKLIKKPKDQWGMSVPIEALAEKGVYGGGALKLSFTLHIEDETFFG